MAFTKCHTGSTEHCSARESVGHHPIPSCSINRESALPVEIEMLASQMGPYADAIRSAILPSNMLVGAIRNSP